MKNISSMNPTMMIKSKWELALLIATGLLLFSCDDARDKFDASGSFEAEETIISAEATGVLLAFTPDEGQELREGQTIGYVDSTQLYLRKKQLESQIRSILSQRPDIKSQIAALQVQLASAEREQKRINNLLGAGAATQKQMDDANSQVEMIRKQLNAQQSSLGITSASIREQTSPLKIQIAQLDDQLKKCRLVNPIGGTVLTTYAEASEMAVAGKPLYKIADLSNIVLRAYITGDQFSQLKLNQQVKVYVDDGAENYRELPGRVTWISDKSEFTPRTIQTKHERANLVYATKIKVKNDGSLKLGMYAEVKFQ